MKTLFFDLETAPNPRAVSEYLDHNPFDPGSVKLGNLKDPDKIADKIEAAREHYRESTTEKAALDPGLCNILTIQYAREVDGEVLVAHDMSEAELIETFFQVAHEHKRWVNWTGSNARSNFDLKMLYRRGWALGVKMPNLFEVRERIKNLAAELLAFDDYPSFLSLENAARQLGLEFQATPVKGKDFWRWWRGLAVESTLSADEQRQAAMDYAVQDVRIIQQMAKQIL